MGDDRGRFVEIRHSNGAKTRYLHNSRVLVKTGDRVSQGQIIAEAGNTGCSTGPHLHFDLHFPRQSLGLDPIKYMIDADDPSSSSAPSAPPAQSSSDAFPCGSQFTRMGKTVQTCSLTQDNVPVFADTSSALNKVGVLNKAGGIGSFARDKELPILWGNTPTTGGQRPIRTTANGDGYQKRISRAAPIMKEMAVCVNANRATDLCVLYSILTPP